MEISCGRPVEEVTTVALESSGSNLRSSWRIPSQSARRVVSCRAEDEVAGMSFRSKSWPLELLLGPDSFRGNARNIALGNNLTTAQHALN